MTMRLLIVFMASLILPTFAHAGVVIGGTRFIYPERERSITVSVRNKSPLPYLVSTKVYSGGKWPGATPPGPATSAMIATPPLFALKPGRENSIRLFRTAENLPADRETLFTLSISAIPASQANGDNVQIAVRSGLKLLYRPAGLSGDPENAYRQISWLYAGNQLVVDNPTPYYVTLFQTQINAKPIDNPGIIAPFSQRKTGWCQDTPRCAIRWQAIDDYGRVLPAMVKTLNLQ